MTIAIVSASPTEGFRVTIDQEPPLFYSNGIILAEGLAHQIIASRKKAADLTSILECIEIYEARSPVPDWEKAYKSLLSDMREIVGNARSDVAF